MSILHGARFIDQHDNPAFDPWTSRAMASGGPDRYPSEAEAFVRENGVYIDPAVPDRYRDEPAELTDAEMFDDGEIFGADWEYLDFLMGQRAACAGMPDTLANLDREIGELRASLERGG